MKDGVRVTLKDIANATDLSIRSVSQILNTDQSHAFRAETRDRVIAAAKRLGYRPNAHARSMRSGRVGAVGLLLSTIPHRSVLDYPVLVGIQEELGRRDLHVVVGRLPDDELIKTDRLPRILREWSTDGLMILYTQDIPPQMIDLLREHRMPSIWINAKLDADCVYPDDLEAARSLTRQLIEQGHRRIAYVVSQPNLHYSRTDRIAGYRAEMDAAGLGYGATVLDLSLDVAGNAFVEVERLLSANNPPTAFVAATPADGRGVYGAARSAGFNVPHDVSIVTFLQADTDVDGRQLSGLVLPQHALGVAAASMTYEKIVHPLEKLASRVIPFETRPGDTLAFAPSGR